MEHFFFEGFLPRKKGPMAQRLHELSAVPGALVFYESPRRVVATLAVMAEVFPGRRIALVRELTKLHEEVVRGLTRQVADELAARDEVKGECVLVLEGPVAGEEDQAQAEAQTRSLDEAIAEGLAAGERASALAKRLAKAYGIPRADVYDLIASSGR
jgi:16S rRNA (cytidine1402-2'-O)-methyltransferase